MSAEANKNEREEDSKKEEKEETPLQANLKTTTETSQVRRNQNRNGTLDRYKEHRAGAWSYFFLSKFNSKDVSYEEKLPRNFKEFDNLLGKILVNLEETENVFLNQAKAVLDRDLTLINWRFRLNALQKTLKEKKRDFERVDQTVQCILRLSTHIDNILRKLEKELPETSLIQNAFKYTPERMNMFDAMMKIGISQRDMLQTLSNAVLSINETIECNPSDPVEQFIRILSLHTEVLRTIEMRMGLMEEELKMLKSLRKYLKDSKKPLDCDYFCCLRH